MPQLLPLGSPGRVTAHRSRPPSVYGLGGWPLASQISYRGGSTMDIVPWIALMPLFLGIILVWFTSDPGCQ